MCLKRCPDTPRLTVPLNFDGLLIKVSWKPLYSHIYNYEKRTWTTTNLRQQLFGGSPGELQLHLEASGVRQNMMKEIS